MALENPRTKWRFEWDNHHLKPILYIYEIFKIIENIIQLLRFQPGNAFIPVEIYVETAIFSGKNRNISSKHVHVSSNPWKEIRPKGPGP
jgi:hypothetical protein